MSKNSNAGQLASGLTLINISLTSQLMLLNAIEGIDRRVSGSYGIATFVQIDYWRTTGLIIPNPAKPRLVRLPTGAHLLGGQTRPSGASFNQLLFRTNFV
jgi:hypothetical protein